MWTSFSAMGGFLTGIGALVASIIAVYQSKKANAISDRLLEIEENQDMPIYVLNGNNSVLMLVNNLYSGELYIEVKRIEGIALSLILQHYAICYSNIETDKYIDNYIAMKNSTYVNYSIIPEKKTYTKYLWEKMNFSIPLDGLPKDDINNNVTIHFIIDFYYNTKSKSEKKETLHIFYKIESTEKYNKKQLIFSNYYFGYTKLKNV
jgi:hypothetical protein